MIILLSIPSRDDKKNGKDILKTFRITAWTNSNQTLHRKFFHKRNVNAYENYIIFYSMFIYLNLYIESAYNSFAQALLMLVCGPLVLTIT